MELRENNFGKREFYQAYMSKINWDWLFLKAQMIFGAIFILGILLFILWIVLT